MSQNSDRQPALSEASDIVFAQEHQIESRILGETRTVLVRVPESYGTTSERYPVLVMFDGELPLFTSHAGVITQLSEWEGRIPEMIHVGIPNTDRPRDMIPVAIELPNGRLHGGGADKFLEFLSSELMPAIDGAYRTHPYRILSGTSASGLATAHALATGLPGFGAFIASSPTVGSSDRALFERIETEGVHGEGERFLAIFSGDSDQGSIQADSEALAGLLRENTTPPLDVRHWVHEGEGHCPFDGFRRALLELFEEWQPSDEAIREGTGAIEAHYRKLSTRFGYSIKASISAFEDMGERLIVSEQADVAVDILRFGMKQHGDSARIAFYLAFALVRSGQRPEAKEFLEAQVATDKPGTDRLRVLLEQLRD